MSEILSNPPVYVTEKGYWTWKKEINLTARSVIGLVTNCTDDSDAVVKIYQSGEFCTRATFDHEVAMHCNLKHENVIAFYDHGSLNRDHYFLIMEHAEKGDLLSQFELLPREAWEKEAHFYFPQILKGIEYLHSIHIAHGDIKPENMLVTKDRVLKITDFGFAIPLGSTAQGCKKIQAMSRYGSEVYMAPEVSNLELHCPKKADIWSIGVTLMVLLTNYSWERPHDSDEQFTSFFEMDKSASPWRYLSNYTFPLIVSTVSLYPDGRLSLEQLKNSTWMRMDY